MTREQAEGVAAAAAYLMLVGRIETCDATAVLTVVQMQGHALDEVTGKALGIVDEIIEGVQRASAAMLIPDTDPTVN